MAFAVKFRTEGSKIRSAEFPSKAHRGRLDIILFAAPTIVKSCRFSCGKEKWIESSWCWCNPNLWRMLTVTLFWMWQNIRCNKWNQRRASQMLNFARFSSRPCTIRSSKYHQCTIPLFGTKIKHLCCLIGPLACRSVEFAEGTDCMPHYEKLPSGGKDVIATLCVKLSQKEAIVRFFWKLQLQSSRLQVGCVFL